MAKCPAGSASADISLGGFFALFLILALLWLAYVAFSAYIKCALELNVCFQALTSIHPAPYCCTCCCTESACLIRGAMDSSDAS